jgi:hypothetical protein
MGRESPLGYCSNVVAWPLGELCSRERKLLLGSPIPERSKGAGQTKSRPQSFRLGLGVRLKTARRKTINVKKPTDG